MRLKLWLAKLSEQVNILVATAQAGHIDTVINALLVFHTWHDHYIFMNLHM